MFKKRLDLKGKTFGKLKVLAMSHVDRSRRTIWECICECGRKLIVRGSCLIRGQKSCGCERKGNIKHGMRPLNGNRHFYSKWVGMRQRCNNPRDKSYKHYGGRGIRVCKEWDYFINFYRDMYKSYISHIIKYGRMNTTLDRKDNNGIYSAKNCRWATHKQQARNKLFNNQHTNNKRAMVEGFESINAEAK